MDPTKVLEIRKLSPKYRDELVRILGDQNDWKLLMTNIPEILQKDNYECRIGQHNLPRYSPEHIRIIENASTKSGRPGCDILFDEWGSSGRVRPCLGHLYFLLKELQIFQAADNIAKLLKEPLPVRPADGPAARIELKLDELKIIEDEPNLAVIVEAMAYPSDISAEANVILQNRENTSEMLENMGYPSNISDEANILLVNHNNSSALIPNISDLLDTQSTQNQESIDNNTSSESSIYIPRVLDSMDEESLEIPGDNYTLLRKLVFEGTITDPFPDIQRSRNTGPGLTLSLNTPLRHFAYSDLKEATDNFDTTPVENFRIVENATKGRFLGSGGYGSVYLALGLPHESVAAVKKIALEGQMIGKSLQDHILSSFKREVETVYKFKHDNLVALLGYSCDGPSICLVYEYIAGGTLKNQLADKNTELHWKDRIHIALGICNAVSYLHTANPKEPLVHRDIKTANILLDGMNKPKLCDYGTARLSKHTTSHTMNVQGTGPYMSPEGTRGDVSVKLDTFSFGVVLLELLTGMAPLDETRSSFDLLTYVRDFLSDYNDDIRLLLDKRAGDWQTNGIHFGILLYKICKKCVEDAKTDRPFMINIRDLLEILLDKLKDRTDGLPHFCYEEIKEGTNNFDEKNVIIGSNYEKIQPLYGHANGHEYLAMGLFDETAVVKAITSDGQAIVNQGFHLNSFKGEVEKLSKLKHENLIAILGYSCEYPNYYILYEHIQGDNLQNRLKDVESPLLWTDRISIALKISRAIVYLHTIIPNKPVVHRSIKSATILLDNNNKPKLRIDELCKKSSMKTLSISLANPYMSPEGVRGDISVKLDTFSFGIVLLELLTGLEPLDDARSSFDILTYVCDQFSEHGNDITSLLDVNAGDWCFGSLHVGKELYKISAECVKDKGNRPLMVAVSEQLEALWEQTHHRDESFRPALSILMYNSAS